MPKTKEAADSREPQTTDESSHQPSWIIEEQFGPHTRVRVDTAAHKAWIENRCATLPQTVPDEEWIALAEMRPSDAWDLRHPEKLPPDLKELWKKTPPGEVPARDPDFWVNFDQRALERIRQVLLWRERVAHLWPGDEAGLRVVREDAVRLYEEHRAMGPHESPSSYIAALADWLRLFDFINFILRDGAQSEWSLLKEVADAAWEEGTMAKRANVVSKIQERLKDLESSPESSTEANDAVISSALDLLSTLADEADQESSPESSAEADDAAMSSAQDLVRTLVYEARYTEFEKLDAVFVATMLRRGLSSAKPRLSPEYIAAALSIRAGAFGDRIVDRDPSEAEARKRVAKSYAKAARIERSTR